MTQSLADTLSTQKKKGEILSISDGNVNEEELTVLKQNAKHRDRNVFKSLNATCNLHYVEIEFSPRDHHGNNVMSFSCG